MGYKNSTIHEIVNVSKSEEKRLAKQELERLEIILDSMRREVANLNVANNKIIELDSLINTKEKTIHDLNLQIESLGSSLRAGRQEESQIEKKICQLESEVKEQEAKLQDINKKHSAVKKEIGGLDVKIHQHTTDLSNLTDKIQKATQLYSNLQLECEKYLKNKDLLAKECVEMEMYVKEKQDEKHILEKEVAKLVTSLTKSQSQITLVEEKASKIIERAEEEALKICEGLSEQKEVFQREQDKVLSEMAGERKWLEEDRAYLREVKNDLESTYKIKIQRVI